MDNEPTGQQQRQQQEPKGQQTQQPQQEPKGGGPDLKQANSRLNEENKALKASIEQMQAQLDAITKKFEGAKTADDVEAAVAAAKKEAEEEKARAKADYDASMKALTVQNALIQAGCADTVALMAHIDMDGIEVASDGHISGLDPARLKESYPYLFNAANTQATVATAAAPGGAARKMTKEEIVKVKDPAERRRLIAENLDLFEN